MQAEAELDEIVKLVGMDALSPRDRLTLEQAQSLREDYLQQNAFSDTDAYTPLQQQYALASLILYFGEKAEEAIDKGADIQKISELPVREQIGRAKAAAADQFEEQYTKIRKEIDRQLEMLVQAAEGSDGE